MAQIQYCKGDIFNSTAQVIVNTVNCEGFMGKGLALAFKQRYPAMFPIYQEECKTGKLRIGKPTLYRASTPWILNFPTKYKWRANSKLEYLEKSLEYFVAHYKQAEIKSIAFPKLGAQNGKLSWDDVGPLMVKYLSEIDIDVYIYIAEGDKEYYPSHKNEGVILEYFNEIASSIDLLQQEVYLSSREAKKVFERRSAEEFTSPSDIYAIEDLAKVSLQRIKEYIHRLRYPTQELPGLEQVKKSDQDKGKRKKHSTKLKRKSVLKQHKNPVPSPLFVP